MKPHNKRILLLLAVCFVELVNCSWLSPWHIVAVAMLAGAYLLLNKMKCHKSIVVGACLLSLLPLCQSGMGHPSGWMVAAVCVALLFSVIRVTRWCKHAYREALFAFALMSANILAALSGHPGYLLAMMGIGIWYTNTPVRQRRTFDTSLLVLAVLLSCVGSSPLLPSSVRLSAGITILPIIVIWVKQVVELWGNEYRDFSTGPDREQPLEADLRYKRLSDGFFYHLCFGLWYAVSCLPMWLLYGLSTLISFILFYIVRYRRRVVHKNLTDSFPEKSAHDIYKIERQYYQHFCDLLVESVKFFSISEEEMRKRMVYKNLEFMRQTPKSGKMLALYLGHYANWEWVSSIPLVLGDVCTCTQLYHPLENKVFDRLVAYTRERWGGISIPASESLRHIVRLKGSDKPVGVGFIADQVPLWNNIHYWTRFLHHPNTPVFTGAERLMKMLDMDVYYVDMRRVSRGHYEVEFKLITKTPKEMPEFQITEEYTRMLEQTINEAPPYWLWSHNRWKRTREEYNRIFGITE